jgi:tRNA 5-methylaminomethyl-2-thiouridine biosynthesis bifunctional protein
MPLVGPVMSHKDFIAHYQPIALGNAKIQYQPAQYYPNLYISSGHGSKGLSSSLLAGEILACLMTNEVLPIAAKTYQAIHPSRFWLRQIKRSVGFTNNTR